MEKKNVVSLWLGNMGTDSALSKYTEEGYAEDGESIPSPFCKDFFAGEEPYEYDYLERYVVEHPSNDLKRLLQGCSYDQSLFRSLDNTILVQSYDTVILIYDFAYEEKEEKTGFPVHFERTIPYEKDSY